MADSIVEKLLALGWRYNAEGVLCQPPECPSVPLWVDSDKWGDRYFLERPRRSRVLWIRGADDVMYQFRCRLEP